MDYFDQNALMQAAAHQVPDADFEPTGFEESLQMLLAGLRDEANLTDTGTMAEVARIVQSLKRRRLLSRLLKASPEIRDVGIPAPIVIVGFPRTGTTMLHNIFAANPRHRAIRLWEMREPFAPENASNDWIEKAKETTTQLVSAMRQMAPLLADIHPLDALWPDECSWLFRNGFATLVNAFQHFMPTYTHWMMQRDMSADYAYYRLQLQAILFQRPGAPLILKDPCHLWHLPALLKTLPDARIIHLHRDICQVASSFASLCHALQEGLSHVRPHEVVGSYTKHMLEVAMTNMLAARRDLPAEHFIDLSYTRLVANPVDTLEWLHGQLRLPWDTEAKEAALGWFANGKKLTGRHRYSLETFGLNAGALREKFAPYRDRFSNHLGVS